MSDNSPAQQSLSKDAASPFTVLLSFKDSLQLLGLGKHSYTTRPQDTFPCNHSRPSSCSLSVCVVKNLHGSCRLPHKLGGCNSEQNLALHISEGFCNGLALDRNTCKLTLTGEKIFLTL